MRTILVLAGLLAIAAVPVTGAAQHGATPAPAVHAAATPKPATAGGEGATTHAATPAKPAEKPVEKTATKPASSAKAGAAPAESAPVAKHEARAVAEVKPAAKSEPSGKPGEKASDKAATGRKGAPFSDLEAAFDRIAQKIDGAEMVPGGIRISSGGAERAVEARPAEARPTRGETPSRIRLTWRSSVVWPSTLGPVEPHSTEPAHETSHIALAWP